MNSNESLLDSYNKRANSNNTQSPEVERLFYFPDERTCSSQVREHNERTCSSVLNSSVEWHPFQRVDNNGIPKQKDLLDCLMKFVIGYGDFKADGKIPGLLSEEVRVSFTVCNNWLNHARLVSYTHSFWYLEFKVKNLRITALMRSSCRSNLFL
jgi:hypothetical protein